MSLVDDDITTGQLDVLLIEDDDGDALLVVEHLRDTDLDAHVVRAGTLAEGIARLGQRPVDCVLLDLDLPDGKGLACLDAVLERRGDAPVIVLTGLDDQVTGVTAVAAGADDYLVKSVVDDHLLAKSMRYALERRRAAAASLQLLEAELRRHETLRIERGLLPRPLLADPALDFQTIYRPGGGGSVLGGDFLDLVERPDGTIRVVIGDVCGHGPDEAALGACLRIGWRSLVLAGVSDTDVMGGLDDLLCSERPGNHFVTVADLTLAADRRSLTYRLAGHWPPLLLTGGCTALGHEERGFPLGLGRAGWSDHRVDLPDRWRIVVYTDGLIEARDGSGELLGLEGLCRLLDDVGDDLDAADLVSRVEALNGGPITDDVALGALSWPGSGSVRTRGDLRGDR